VKPKKFTPLQSIRKQCLYCMGGSFKLVNECETITCVLWSYRTGIIQPGADRRLLRIIRAFCLECVEGYTEVKNCTGKMVDGHKCNFHQYRCGKRPKKHEQEASFASNFNELVEA
jgi:hypothetical protein